MTQLPGNLPDGATLDSMLTVEQAATWLQVRPATINAWARRKKLPGISSDHRNRRLHPRTYLEQKGKR